MDVLKKIKASTILENLIACVILMIIFILAGNALNTSFKSSIKARDLVFDNDIKKTEYLLLNNKIQTPQYIEGNNKSASFQKEENTLIIEVKKHSNFKETRCCIKN